MSTLNEGSVAIFPAISFAPETSLQIGAVGIWALKDNSKAKTGFQRQSTITPYLVYTLNKQFLAVSFNAIQIVTQHYSGIWLFRWLLPQRLIERMLRTTYFH